MAKKPGFHYLTPTKITRHMTLDSHLASQPLNIFYIPKTKFNQEYMVTVFSKNNNMASLIFNY